MRMFDSWNITSKAFISVQILTHIMYFSGVTYRVLVCRATITEVESQKISGARLAQGMKAHIV